MRILIYLFLFFIGYYVVKIVLKSLKSSPKKTTIHNSRMRKKGSNYDNVDDAQYTEIPPDEEKKNNN